MDRNCSYLMLPFSYESQVIKLSLIADTALDLYQYHENTKIESAIC